MNAQIRFAPGAAAGLPAGSVVVSLKQVTVSCFWLSIGLTLSNVDVLTCLSQCDLTLALAVAGFLNVTGRGMTTRATHAELI